MLRIKWYEGGCAQQNPQTLYLPGEELQVDEVIERARVFDMGTQGYQRLIKVRCGDRIFRLTQTWDEWSVSEEK